jgi:hypothetical protein
VNLIIGVTLATSAAMVIGVHGQTEFFYAVLQTTGAVATVIILFGIAHTAMPLGALGLISYTMIFLGGVMTGAATGPLIYAVGLVAVIGFDKMFNVYIRSLRQRIIPPQDFGKTTGLIVMLNNLSQPVAGLLVGGLRRAVGRRRSDPWPLGGHGADRRPDSGEAVAWGQWPLRGIPTAYQ